MELLESNISFVKQPHSSQTKNLQTQHFEQEKSYGLRDYSRKATDSVTVFLETHMHSTIFTDTQEISNGFSDVTNL